jgi:hypothetical protein
MSPEGLTYAGTGFAPSELPSPTVGSAGDSGYELYTIAGLDPAQAIAVKFIAASLSEKGAPYRTQTTRGAASGWRLRPNG